MHNRTSWWAAIAIGIAACTDPQGPTSPASLTPGPQPRLDLVATTTNPTLIEGNISGNGTAVCAEVNTTGTPWLGQKVDGADDATIAGYRFTISGGDRYVSYQPVAGATPTHTIVAVLVKGGPNAYLYAPTSAGTLMRAPDNNGGNVPQISHYSVCYVPKWTVEKKLTQVFGGTLAQMVPLGTTQPVSVPVGETRWLEFHITVTGPAGGAAPQLEDLAATACATLPAGFKCELPNEYGGPAMGDFTYVDADPSLPGNQAIGPGTYHFMIDVYNTGAVCGAGGPVHNTARLTPSGGAAQTSTATVDITSPGCWQVGKSLVTVYRHSDTAPDGMESVPFVAGQAIGIPVGEIRWLEYTLTATKHGNVGPATLHDLALEACAQLPAGFRCMLPPEYSPSGAMADYTYPGTLTQSASHHFMIDVYNDGGGCGAGGVVTNKAQLTSGGAAILASVPVTVQSICP